MSWNLQQEEDGEVIVVAQGGGSDAAGKEVRVKWASGVEAGFFRGTTDSDITGVVAYNEGGTKTYIYPDSTGTSIVVSTSAP